MLHETTATGAGPRASAGGTEVSKLPTGILLVTCSARAARELWLAAPRPGWRSGARDRARARVAGAQTSSFEAAAPERRASRGEVVEVRAVGAPAVSTVSSAPASRSMPVCRGGGGGAPPFDARRGPASPKLSRRRSTRRPRATCSRRSVVEMRAAPRPRGSRRPPPRPRRGPCLRDGPVNATDRRASRAHVAQALSSDGRSKRRPPSRRASRRSVVEVRAVVARVGATVSPAPAPRSTPA